MEFQESTNQKQPKVVTVQYSFDGLTKTHIWAYGIGHILNDMSATFWYGYFLYFLKKILFVDLATEVMLIGQVVDGVITPIIGYSSGKCSSRIGQRKPWYIASIFAILIPNALLYSGFKSQNRQIEALFYILATMLFCFGYASMQINHMSLVPAITCSRKRRDQLNNLRSVFTFASNFIVLGFGVLIFSLMSDKLLQYKILVYTCTFVGVCASAYFVYNINQSQLTNICKQKQAELKKILQKEKSSHLAPKNDQPICNLVIQSAGLPLQNQQAISDCKTAIEVADPPTQNLPPVSNCDFGIQVRKTQKTHQNVQTDSILDWFRVPKFYLLGVCYVGAQMYVSVFGILIPFYITDVLKLVENTEQSISFNLALIPMLICIGSVVVSCKLDYLYSKIGRKYSLLLGSLLCVNCSITMVVIDESNAKYFYGVVVVVGVSQSLVLSTAFTMISDVVAAKEKSGTFVFGIYSLLDKVSVGICVFFVTGAEAYSKTQDLITDSDRNYIKWTTILVPSISCFISAIILSVTSVNEYTNNENESGDSPGKKTPLQKELIL